MIDKLVFIFMILTALFVATTNNFKRMIVALATFSLLASFCYLLYHAPDVALAEAVIGSALSTILYIVALKKHRSFYIYFSSKENVSDRKTLSDTDDVVSKVLQYCTEHELEAQHVFTWESPSRIAREHLFDIIIAGNEKIVTVYGSEVERHVVAIREILERDLGKRRVRFKTLQDREVL